MLNHSCTDRSLKQIQTLDNSTYQLMNPMSNKYWGSQQMCALLLDSMQRFSGCIMHMESMKS